MRKPCPTARRLALLRAAWRNAKEDRTARRMAQRLGRALFNEVPAQSVLDGYKGTISQTAEGAPMVTPMVTALNTQIRLKSQDLINQGTTIAQYVQHGVTTGFNAESFKTVLISVGESLYANIRTGLLNAADGGDLVESLGAKILADISAEVEAP